MMDASKILFTTDFSRFSASALPIAVALARESGAELLIAHVEERSAAYAGGGLFLVSSEPNLERIRESLSQVIPNDPEIAHRHLLLRGHPAEAVLECAKREKVDLIVIGTHGRSGLSKLLLGSVAERIFRNAPCAVLTVKLPSVNFTEEDAIVDCRLEANSEHWVEF
ncbi:MAG: universal stress protein [Planctomycetales bacterium]